jgi:ArsR family transcriptional regulator
MNDVSDEIVLVLRALGNERRLRILEWLKDPEAHFPPQVDGDLVRDGVCALLIADKMDISQPTLSEHMRILVQAKLVEPKRVKKWTFYRRNNDHIKKIKKMMSENI